MFNPSNRPAANEIPIDDRDFYEKSIEVFDEECRKFLLSFSNVSNHDDGLHQIARADVFDPDSNAIVGKVLFYVSRKGELFTSLRLSDQSNS